MLEEALEVAQDPDYRFDLAVQLGDLDTALGIAQTSDSESKWKQLVEFVLANGRLDVRWRFGVERACVGGTPLLCASVCIARVVAHSAVLHACRVVVHLLFHVQPCVDAVVCRCSRV